MPKGIEPGFVRADFVALGVLQAFAHHHDAAAQVSTTSLTRARNLASSKAISGSRIMCGGSLGCSLASTYRRQSSGRAAHHFDDAQDPSSVAMLLTSAPTSITVVALYLITLP